MHHELDVCTLIERQGKKTALKLIERILGTLTEASGYVRCIYVDLALVSAVCQNLFKPKNQLCTIVYETDKLVNCFKVKSKWQT